MLKTPLSYWDQIAEMMQENYKLSLSATQQFQETYSHLLKETFETNARSVKEMQEGFKSLTAQNFNTSMETMKKYSELFIEMHKKGLSTLRTLFEKYSVDNSFIREIEQFWQETTSEYQKQFQMLGESLMKEQEKHIDMQIKTYNEYAKEMVEKLNTKMDEEKGTTREDKKKK
jgi:hypothetical protein